MATSARTKSASKSSRTLRRTRSSRRQEKSSRAKAALRRKRTPALDDSEDDISVEEEGYSESEKCSRPTVAMLRRIPSVKKATVANGQQRETFEVGDWCVTFSLTCTLLTIIY